MAQNEIVVGNIGMVYNGIHLGEAMRAYSVYRKQSMSGVGRAGGESVYWFKNGELYREFIGDNDVAHDTDDGGESVDGGERTGGDAGVG